MRIMECEVDGINVRFVCESGNTRHGFKHTVTMFEDGFCNGSYTAYYLNRTWESFQYQTAMLGCIRVAKDNLFEILKSEFKNKKGISRMTARYKVEFEEMLKSNVRYNFYEKLYSNVSLGQVR